MSGIVDHKSNDKAVSKSDRYVVIRRQKLPRKTTVGWKLCIEWRDGSKSWEQLSDMKEAYPVLVAEYALKKRFKYGFEVPETVARAIDLDEINGNKL